jgi:transcriptional regulator with XRE-family HTH domain
LLILLLPSRGSEADEVGLAGPGAYRYELLYMQYFIMYDKIMTWGQISTDLRRLRRTRGMTLSRLARLARTSVATLSRYESGWNRFEINTLRKLATALGYRVEVVWHPLESGGARESESQLVRRLGRLFWDRRLERGDLQRHPRWIVDRVIQYGKVADILALSTSLGRKRFLGIVSDLRMPSPKVERFWRAMLRIEGVSCTKKPSRPQVAISWPV